MTNQVAHRLQDLDGALALLEAEGVVEVHRSAGMIRFRLSHRGMAFRELVDSNAVMSRLTQFLQGARSWD